MAISGHFGLDVGFDGPFDSMSVTKLCKVCPALTILDNYLHQRLIWDYLITLANGLWRVGCPYDRASAFFYHHYHSNIIIIIKYYQRRLWSWIICSSQCSRIDVREAAACDLPDLVVAKFKGEKGECEDCDEDLIARVTIIWSQLEMAEVLVRKLNFIP